MFPMFLRFYRVKTSKSLYFFLNENFLFTVAYPSKICFLQPCIRYIILTFYFQNPLVIYRDQFISWNDFYTLFQTSAEMPVETSGIAMSNVGFTYFSKFDRSSLLHSRNLQRSPSLDVNCLFLKLSTLLTILMSSTASIWISSLSASTST